MMADYWDAGYLTFDVTNPADPRYIGDSTFDGPDPLTGLSPQEGNGHQGEFSHDNKYILAADEDFSPYRPACSRSRAARTPASTRRCRSAAAPQRRSCPTS
jgi:hypothetical protein